MRSRHVAIAALGATAVSIGIWFALRPGGDGSTWTVTATVDDPVVADEACGDRPGVKTRSFSMTSDLAPGLASGGVHWTVEGRDEADRVAACLVEHGATSPKIEAGKPRISFEPAGP